MAKQRGVVQLSGRVDNLCYYQQKRVRGGLVRRINLAMSERVKAGADYANLRVANSFFGVCSMMATALINLLNQRVLYMTRSDRQSYVTAHIKRMFNSSGRNADNRDAGYRFGDGLRLSQIFNSIMKVRATDFFPSLPLVEDNVVFDSTMVLTIPSEELDRYLSYFGGVSVRVNFYYDCYIYYSGYTDGTGKYSKPESSRSVNRVAKIWRPGDGDLELLIPAGMHDDTFSCYILFFDIEKYSYYGRPVLLTSASTAHMVSMYFD